MFRSDPDFYIAGGASGDKVVLLASISLRHLELNIEDDDLEMAFFNDYLSPPKRTCTLTAESPDVIKIIADDYPSAFQRLFEIWSPTGNQPGIEGMKALDG